MKRMISDCAPAFPPLGRFRTGLAPIMLALLALIAGIWAVGISMDMSRLCPDFTQEGSSAHTELATWPPGAFTCQVTARNGSQHTSTVIPLREELAIVLFALAVGAGAAGAARRRTNRATWLVCACLLTLASALVSLIA